MRIALFTEVFLPKVDGVVTRIVRTLDQLAEAGHEVLVFAPGNPPKTYRGFDVIGVPSVSFRPWYPELSVGLPTAKIVAALEEFRPHIVHAVNPVWFAAWGALEARRRNIPLLASFHTDVPAYSQRLGLEWISQAAHSWIVRMHNLAQVNLCTSQQMIGHARGMGIRSLDLWPKAVDTAAYRPEVRSERMRAKLSGGHPEDRILLYVGRLSKEKDLLLLREVLDRVPDDVRLAFVGSGPHREELEEAFAGTRTVFTGYMAGEELAEAYASADLFAFPSTTETLGLVALESMASGVPVVAADAGGLPYAVSDGVTGLLHTPHDAADMAEKIMRILDDETLREHLAAAGRASAEAIGWPAATQALVGFYETAIGRFWTDTRPPHVLEATFGAPIPRA